MITMALVEQDGREASVGRHRLSLVNISICLNKFMRAGYQQTAEMLYLSNIQTQEGNNTSTNYFSKPERGRNVCISFCFD